MKILLTVHQFFPEFSAGTEVLTYGVAKELQRMGHEVLVFAACPTGKELKDDERFDYYLYDDIRVERFYYALVPMGGQANVMEMEYHHELVAGHFRKLLERENPDIVHFFHLRRLSSSMIPECRSARLPAFYTPTDFWAACPLNQLCLPEGQLCPGPDSLAANCVRHLAQTYVPGAPSLIGRLPIPFFRLIAKMARAGAAPRHPYVQMVKAVTNRRDIVVSRLNELDGIFIPSRITGAVLENIGVDTSRMRWSPFGINLNQEPVPHQVDPAGRLRIGFIGTLNEFKGAHLLVEALRSTPDLPAELKIYGKLDEVPAYVEKLRKLIADDPRITLCGSFDNAEIGKVFSMLDALVVPSVWHENTPLVVYSAQACGCPVIASDLGGLSEVVRHDENGVLFPAGQIRELAAVLIRLHEDRGLLGRLAANSRPPRSIADYVAELLEGYRAAIAARRKT